MLQFNRSCCEKGGDWKCTSMHAPSCHPAATHGSLMGREVFQDKWYNLNSSCSGGGNGGAGDLNGRHPGRLQRVLGSHGFPPSQNHYPQFFCHQWIRSLLAVCHQSVQAPLFPIEASGKGATGSQISPGIIEKNDQTYLNQFWAPCTRDSSSHPFLSPSWSAGRSQNIMFVNFSQVWSLLRLPGWTPCGHKLRGSLWHNHLRLRPQPVLALRLPGQVP